MQTKVNQTEHSPSPQPARGIYGFILGSFCALFILSYALWIVIPAEVIDTWPYQPPQKYWAAAVPIFFCTALFMFAFFIYPSLHLLYDGELDESSAITDCHALAPDETAHVRLTRSQKQNTLRGLSLKLNRWNTEDPRVNELREIPIPSASDIKMEDVSRILYLHDHDAD